MASFEPYAVLFYVEGFAFRALATFPTAPDQARFVSYITGTLGGVLQTDWYMLETIDLGNDAIDEATSLAGIVYNLPLH